MKGLHGVIGLNRRRLEEKRRRLAGFLARHGALSARLAKLEESVRAEQAVTENVPEVAYAYGNFAGAVVASRVELRTEIARARDSIDAARGQVLAAYRELRKYETVAEEQAGREAAGRARRERAELDEIAGARFRRAATAINR